MPVTVRNFVRNRDVGGKFVVVREADGEGGVFLISDFTRDFQHADIVQRWRDNDAAAARVGQTIAGGGWWRLRHEVLDLYGQSAAYGRYQIDWLRQRLAAGTVFGEREISMR